MSRRRHRVDSLGRALLLFVLQSTSRRELAGRLHVAPCTLSLWASGKRSPDWPSRQAIARLFDMIDPDSWDVPSNVTPVTAPEGIVQAMQGLKMTIRLGAADTARLERLRAPGTTIAGLLAELVARGLDAAENQNTARVGQEIHS